MRFKENGSGMVMTVGSLFAGIGGFELAAQWAGLEPVWSNEIDPFCCQVLRKNFKHRIIEDDIRNIGKHNLEPVDILTGGFPCQDLSVASSNGKKGFSGNKSGLYAELIRIVREIRPRHAVIENVYGLVTQDNGEALERMLGDLAIDGYSSIPLVIYSSAIGANHHRKRVFTYATRLGDGVQAFQVQAGRDVAINIPGWDSEPEICRVYDGLPEQLDKRRLSGLGNAIVPQVALEIFKAIKEVESLNQL